MEELLCTNYIHLLADLIGNVSCVKENKVDYNNYDYLAIGLSVVIVQLCILFMIIWLIHQLFDILILVGV